MPETNIITQENTKEIEALKQRLYAGKCKRLEVIDSYIDKIKTELDTRDLKDIPTPLLTKMFISFAELAKKEYPQIELQYKEMDTALSMDFLYKTEKVIL